MSLRMTDTSLFSGTHKLVLLLNGLESTMTIFGRSIDEFEVDGFQVRSASRGDNGLAESDWALLRTSNTSLHTQPILIDNTVVRETTNRGDTLLSQVVLSGGTGSITLLTNSKDALVDLGTVMVTLLTGTSDSAVHTRRMPSTNTGDLTQTTVGLAGKTSNTPTSNNTNKSLTLGGSANINTFTFSEDIGNWDLLFEELLAEINLLSDAGTAVDLNFSQVSHLLAQVKLAHLGVAEQAYNLTIVLDAVELELNILRLLSSLLGILGESLLLGSVPVLVEATLDFIRKMASPNSGKSAKTSWGFDVTNHTNSNKRRSFKDSNGLNSFLLVQFGSRSLNLTNNVSHTSLETNEGSQVARSTILQIISGEFTATTMMVTSALAGAEAHGTMTR